MAKKRIPMSIKLYNQKNEMVLSTVRTVKSRIINDVQIGFSNNKAIRGICTVWYNKSKGYYNRFVFTSKAEFEKILHIDTERSLIEDYS